MSHYTHVTCHKYKVTKSFTKDPVYNIFLEISWKIQFNYHDKNIAYKFWYMLHMLHVTNIYTPYFIYFWKYFTKLTSIVMIKTSNINKTNYDPKPIINQMTKQHNATQHNTRQQNKNKHNTI